MTHALTLEQIGAQCASRGGPALPMPAAASGAAAFAEPWQAHAFALTLQLHERGLFSWAEWATALAAEIRRAFPQSAPAAVPAPQAEPVVQDTAVLPDDAEMAAPDVTTAEGGGGGEGESVAPPAEMNSPGSSTCQLERSESVRRSQAACASTSSGVDALYCLSSAAICSPSARNRCSCCGVASFSTG